MNKVAVIGGGAAGLMAALEAARGGASVTIFEHKDRIGKKILMTGNGKCNFSNLSFSDKDYYTNNYEFLNSIFAQFSNIDAKDFFVSNGILVKEKNNYLYPITEQASTILDFFRRELEYFKVKIHTDFNVSKIRVKQKDEKNIFLIQDEKEYFDCIIMANGGKAAPQSGSDGSGYQIAQELGHRIITPLPSLVQLRSSENYFKSIAGVRCDSFLKLCVDGKSVCEETGELQLTEYGISGIPVFQLSGMAAEALHLNKRVEVIIDFLPSISMVELTQHVKIQIARIKSLKREPDLEEALMGLLNKKILFMIIKQSGFSLDTKVSQIQNTELEKLLTRMKKWYVKITNTNPFANAQVCRGGVDCMELNSQCESKIVPGLYFAGEIINVDGRCGGYNLQWAWSSGFVAGRFACSRNKI